MKISIVSLCNIIRINVPTKSDYDFFTTIFQPDDEGNILCIQVADAAFKSNFFCIFAVKTKTSDIRNIKTTMKETNKIHTMKK